MLVGSLGAVGELKVSITSLDKDSNEISDDNPVFENF